MNSDYADIFSKLFGGLSPGGLSPGGLSPGGSYDEFLNYFKTGTPPSQYPNKPNVPPTKSQPQIMTLDFGVNLVDFYLGSQKKAKLTYDDVTKNKVIEFGVQPGWREGVKITFQKEAWDSSALCYTDLIIVLKEKEGSLFKRKAYLFPDPTDDRPDNEKFADLIYYLKITIDEAVKGFQKTLKHLDDRTFVVAFEGTDHTEKKEIVVIGEGMPIRKEGKVVGKGDLYVKFEIQM